MIRKRIWTERRKVNERAAVEWMMEGWYFLGLIPLYVRDLSPRGTYGDDAPVVVEEEME